MAPVSLEATSSVRPLSSKLISNRVPSSKLPVNANSCSSTASIPDMTSHNSFSVKLTVFNASFYSSISSVVKAS